ncbi:HdeD family acid-resistance protein [Streptococcus ferus]|uniref:HdeD family acid-resistance protein n=1 Tax=Streptococcus ferus TaxID=1345 RepID=UPI0023535503|nr:DUF308 domain-containing protein [Streptococcus ferus]
MKNLTLVVGLSALLLGIYLFTNPLLTVAWLGWLLGLIVLISGIGGVVSYLNRDETSKNVWQLIQYLISIFLGFLLLSSSIFSITKIAFTIVAYWTVFIGITRLMVGFRLRQAGLTNGNRHILSALITILIGLIFLSQPILSSAIIGRFIALLFITAGISTLFLSFRLPS